VSTKEETSAAGFNNRRQFKGFQHPKSKEEKIRAKLENFAVAEERLANLERIVKERRSWGLIFAEIPVHPAVRRLFPGGEADARRAMEHAAARATVFGAPVVRLENGAFGDALLWRDYYHLNTRGAVEYSRWLGAKLAEVLREGGGWQPGG